jgi:putative flippase GtrA
LIAKRDVDPAWANATASLGATVFSYLAHTLWSFSAAPSKSNLQRFAVVSLASCGLSAALAQIAVWWEWSYYLGILLVVSVVPAATFAAHHLWTYASE